MEISRNFNYIFLGLRNSYILSTFSYAMAANRFLRKKYGEFDIILEDFAPWNPIFSYRLKHQRPVVLQIQNYLGREIINKYFMLGLPFWMLERYYPLNFSYHIVLEEALNYRWNIEGKVISQGVPFTDNLITEGYYVGYLGRIDIHQKGLDIFLDAAEALPHIRFVVAGYGVDEKRLIKRIRNTGNINFIGRVSGQSKWKFIKDARFMVAPSRHEGQSIAVIEAAAMGKPVIVSDIPELKYVEREGFGLSFRKGNFRDLVEKIEYLWNSEKLLQKYGRRALGYARQFTWDEVACRYEAYLMECLNSFGS
ncbi:MAG: glycosyltransferase family 4 protein [Nitrososphaerota archaeon]